MFSNKPSTMRSSDMSKGSTRLPMTPPLLDLPESRPLSASMKTSPSPPSKTFKRKASPDKILLSQTLSPFGKKPRIVRSSSQPPLRNRMARRDNETPEFDEDGMPVRYTPTTGRISKAKKGLPVHYCQYGCGKVYTRAEHRKRHEQNHRKDAMFRCTVPDCQKEFQRFDLFQRHLEKQHGQGLGVNDRARASSVESSIASSSAPDMQDQMAGHGLRTPMTLGMATPPYTSTYPSYPMEQSQSQIGWQTAQPMPPTLGSNAPDSYQNMYADSLRHSSQQMAQMHGGRARRMSAPAMDPHEQFGSEVMHLPSTPSTGAWPSTPFWPQQTMSAGSGAFQEAFGAVDGHDRGQWSSRLDRVSGRSFNSSTGLPPLPDAPDGAELVDLDAEHLQHYHECYWAHFDPLFPIVHKPSYSPASTESALLGAMMVAIGAQFSPRPYSAAHSMESYELACSMIDQTKITDDIQDASATTLQGMFLWEYLSLYKRRAPGIHRSQHFLRIYNGLVSLVGLADEDSSELAAHEETAEHEAWINVETRKRLLTACFILDTYRCTLFSQPSARALPPDATLPAPCSHDLWNAPDAVIWQSLVATGRMSPTATPFKIAFDNTLHLHLQGTLDVESPLSLHFAGWALQLATTAPIRSMLILANENVQLYQQQIAPEDWTIAKGKIDQWLASPLARVDALYAGRVLNTYFATNQTPQGTATEVPNAGLETEWCLYIATITVWAFTTLSTSSIQGQPAQAYQDTLSVASSSPASVVGHAIPPTSLLSSPTSTDSSRSLRPQQSIETMSSRQSSRQRSRSKLSSGQQQTAEDPALRYVLQYLDVSDASLLDQHRGMRGTAPLMIAVRDVLAHNMSYKSAAIREGVDILGNLIESEEIKALMGV